MFMLRWNTAIVINMEYSKLGLVHLEWCEFS